MEDKRGDRVYTPDWVVADMLSHFGVPEVGVLEPFRGQGAFTSRRPRWDWCEIDGRREVARALEALVRS